MKTNKQNNPVVVGILVAVLTATTGLTVMRFRASAATTTPQITPVSAVPPGTVTPVATPPATAAPAAPGTLPAPMAATAPVVPARSSRNPFAAAPKPVPAAKRNGTGAAFDPEVVMTEAPGVLPPLARRGKPGQRYGTNAALAPAPVTPQAAPGPDPLEIRYQEEQALLKKLRLTAIIDGVERSAVLETAGAPAISVRIGDYVRTLQVVAVNATEVVFSGARGLCMLPLRYADAPNETQLTSTEPALPAKEITHAPL